MTQDPPAPASQRTRWFVLTAVSLGLLLATVDTSILYVVVPLLTDELSASVSESLWIINMYPLVMTGLLLGTGTLGDRFGHKLVFQIGISAFGIASLLAAFSPNAWVLIVARALLAVGAALMLPATLAIIRFTFEDEDERNVAIAVWSSVSIGGIAFGPLVGGLLLEWFWWGSVFLINVPFALVTFLLAAMYAPAARASARTSWDLLSSVLALVGLTGLVAAIKQGAVSAPSGAFITGALATSLLLVVRTAPAETPNTAPGFLGLPQPIGRCRCLGSRAGHIRLCRSWGGDFSALPAGSWILTPAERTPVGRDRGGRDGDLPPCGFSAFPSRAASPARRWLCCCGRGLCTGNPGSGGELVDVRGQPVPRGHRNWSPDHSGFLHDHFQRVC